MKGIVLAEGSRLHPSKPSHFIHAGRVSLSALHN